ncbi:MAG: hypothetical protein ABI488_00705 [Polyangiaceae bacterium]
MITSARSASLTPTSRPLTISFHEVTTGTIERLRPSAVLAAQLVGSSSIRQLVAAQVIAAATGVLAFRRFGAPPTVNGVR